MRAFENTETSVYGTMQDKWSELHGIVDDTSFSVFSMYSSEDVTGEIVKHPDFLSEDTIIAGEVTLEIVDWDGIYEKFVDITWGDIAKFFTTNNDGHHVFLEDISWDEHTRMLRIHTGS